MLNSCLGLFSAACSRRRPFSRSYGAILPSSLTTLLPPALGFSPCLPVSVCGTGTWQAIAAFLGAPYGFFATLVRSASRYWLPRGISPAPPPALAPGFPLPAKPPGTRPRFLLLPCSTGFSTCYPSATPSGLALGPDFPGEDQLYPGNLGHPAWGIPTPISLLIPAFSLPGTPPPLTGKASAHRQCSPTGHTFRTTPGLRRRVSAPDIFGAGPLG